MNPGRLSLEFPFQMSCEWWETEYTRVTLSVLSINQMFLLFYLQNFVCEQCFFDFNLAEEPNNLQALSLFVNRALLHN